MITLAPSFSAAATRHLPAMAVSPVLTPMAYSYKQASVSAAAVWMSLFVFSSSSGSVRRFDGCTVYVSVPTMARNCSFCSA